RPWKSAGPARQPTPGRTGVRPGEYGRGCWTAIQAVKPVIRWRIAGFELAKVVIRQRIARVALGSAGESRWSRGDPPANRKQPPGGRSDPLPDRRDPLAHTDAHRRQPVAGSPSAPPLP